MRRTMRWGLAAVVGGLVLAGLISPGSDERLRAKKLDIQDVREISPAASSPEETIESLPLTATPFKPLPHRPDLDRVAERMVGGDVKEEDWLIPRTEEEMEYLAWKMIEEVDHE